MASPQLEDGFIQIAHSIYEAFARKYIPGKLMQVLWVILRKTYGFKKKSAQIPLAEFTEYTKMQKPNICRALKLLQDCGYVVITGDNDNKIYTFQKDFEKWRRLSRVITKSIITGDNETLSRVIKKKKEAKKNKYKANKNKYTPHVPPVGGCARCVLNFLNETGKKNFPVDNLGFLRKIGKLRSIGYSIEDFTSVIEYKFFDFIGRFTDSRGKYEKPENEKDMRPFYSPATLFKPEKFAIYLGQAKSWREEKKKYTAKKAGEQRIKAVDPAAEEEAKYPGITDYEAEKIKEFQKKYPVGWLEEYVRSKPDLIAEFKKEMGYL
ncbi:MAG: replication protein [Endomicrobium sp.]|jgi:phage replication O-like protein O|nr:replication protein [Endomicrobium sp.]